MKSLKKNVKRNNSIYQRKEAEAKLEVDEKSKELLVGTMQNIQQILLVNKQYL